jgi:membrane-bound lytic murein transglycosylase B
MPSTVLIRRGRRAATLLAAAGVLFAGLVPESEAKTKSPRARNEAREGVPYGLREDVQRWGVELAERHKLDPHWVAKQLGESRRIPVIQQLIMPAGTGTAKNWAVYRSRFVEPKRIRAGLEFWRENAEWLRRAEARFGVPAELVVGLIGVETIYGQQMGSFRAIDALATLSFDFPTGRRDRSGFFRDELEAFLLMCHREDVDPQSIKASYAGAIGMGQFMPSSWSKYAIDFDGDGHINLHTSTADVIGSVANYMAQFGWQTGVPTRFEVTLPTSAENRAVLLAPDILPSFTVEEFTQRGAGLPPEAASYTGKLALVELQNGDDPPSYVAGTSNFYAVTRYNWSSYYAMAVLDLGEAIALVRQRVDR